MLGSNRFHGKYVIASIIILYTKSPLNFLQALSSRHVVLLQTLLDRHVAMPNLTVDFHLNRWTRKFGPLD